MIQVLHSPALNMLVPASTSHDTGTAFPSTQHAVTGQYQPWYRYYIPQHSTCWYRPVPAMMRVLHSPALNMLVPASTSHDTGTAFPSTQHAGTGQYQPWCGYCIPQHSTCWYRPVPAMMRVLHSPALNMLVPASTSHDAGTAFPSTQHAGTGQYQPWCGYCISQHSTCWYRPVPAMMRVLHFPALNMLVPASTSHDTGTAFPSTQHAGTGQYQPWCGYYIPQHSTCRYRPVPAMMRVLHFPALNMLVPASTSHDAGTAFPSTQHAGTGQYQPWCGYCIPQHSTCWYRPVPAMIQVLHFPALNMLVPACTSHDAGTAFPSTQHAGTGQYQPWCGYCIPQHSTCWYRPVPAMMRVLHFPALNMLVPASTSHDAGTAFPSTQHAGTGQYQPWYRYCISQHSTCRYRPVPAMMRVLHSPALNMPVPASTSHDAGTAFPSTQHAGTGLYRPCWTVVTDKYCCRALSSMLLNNLFIYERI